MLRVSCEGEDVGAEVMVNGKFRGECPIDLQVSEGPLKLTVRKNVDAQRERVFEQDIRMGEGSVNKVEALLSTRLNAAAQRREGERLAVELVQAQKRLAEREARDRADLEATLAMARQQGAEVGNGKPFRDCADCPDMLLIPPGNFEMGSNDGGANLKPVHRVSFSRSFALGSSELMQSQWRAIMGSNPSQFKNCGDHCPVENFSWDDVQSFIQKLNVRTGKQYRLPSEAEWEYACRAGGRQEYCGSDDLASVAWYEGNSGKTTHPVAGKQANGFGLYDMSGNVWKWVQDSYHHSYAGASSDGSAGLGDDARRMLRGGSWDGYACAGYRGTYLPAIRSSNMGVRLVRMLP